MVSFEVQDVPGNEGYVSNKDMRSKGVAMYRLLVQASVGLLCRI